jgi:hypothetical protein
MEAVWSYKMLVSTSKNTHCHVPEEDRDKLQLMKIFSFIIGAVKHV